MKGSSRTKTGGKKGNPAYRTPSVFKYKKSLAKKIKHNHLNHEKAQKRSRGK